MNIPSEIVWEIALVLVGFILGTLWGHHAAIGKRVTYEECSKNRKSCPCLTDIDELKKTINTIHPPEGTKSCLENILLPSVPLR